MAVPDKRKPRTVRLLTGLHVSLQDGRKRSVATVTRTGRFRDPRYGEFEITREMLLSMVRNFEQGTYGQDVFVDVSHRPEDGAAAKVTALSVEGERLRATLEWTPYGVEAVRDRGYQYLSAEYVPNFTDNESGQAHGPLLLGAGLTLRPAIKRLDPVQLSEQSDDGPVLVHPALVKELQEEARKTMNKHAEALRKALSEMDLDEASVNGLVSAYQQSAENLGEDEAGLKRLSEQFVETGQALAKQGRPVEVKLSQPAGLSAEQVRQILAEDRAAQERTARELAEKRDSRVGLFRELMEKAEGLDGLADDERRSLSEAEALITPEMSEDQVRKLAQVQIGQGNRLAAARQLSGMGFQGAGSTRVQVSEANSIKRLSEQVREGLRGTMAYGNRLLKLPEKVGPFVERVLSEFDRVHARALHMEAKALASGETNLGGHELPVSYQREVIRESLSDLNVLETVQTLTDAGAQSTTQVPYEVRDKSMIRNGGIVYERQGIPPAGVEQKMSTAYVLGTKISMKVSNEVVHFSRSSVIDWDAWARNMESNSRAARELIHARICNEMLRSADAAASVDITGEDVGAQVDGTNSYVKTANFPVVRPYQAVDNQGNVVGSEVNGIVVNLNSTPLEQYSDAVTTPGTYWTLDTDLGGSVNLGYIAFVDETGAPVTPTGTCVLDYSYTTNVVLFDMDVPDGTTYEKHMNGLVQAVGAAKAQLSADAFVVANYQVMSPVLNDQATNAETFSAWGERRGNSTDQMGDLAGIKGVPAWSTNAPGVDLGDERIVMGQRGTLTYTIAKPWMYGDSFEAVDANGRPTGERIAYGEEYSAIHVPEAIQNRMKTVLAYSATGR